MSRRKSRSAGLPTAKQAPTGLSLKATMEIEVVQIRLRRAQDVLSALAFCADQEAELSLGPVAVAARDLVDRALDGLATLSPKQENAGPGDGGSHG